jgi:bifunctional ADP-heptose synthase (sugar kinase/adenylyltransferase)
MPRFDRKITLDQIITALIAVLSVGIVYGSTNSRLSALEDKVTGLTRVMERIVSLEQQMVRLETKLDERSVREEKLDKKLDDLKEKIK